MNVSRALFLIDNDGNNQMAKFEKARKKKLYNTSGFVNSQ
jgi:hypothetical protein